MFPRSLKKGAKIPVYGSPPKKREGGCITCPLCQKRVIFDIMAFRVYIPRKHSYKLNLLFENIDLDSNQEEPGGRGGDE